MDSQKTIRPAENLPAGCQRDFSCRPPDATGWAPDPTRWQPDATGWALDPTRWQTDATGWARDATRWQTDRTGGRRKAARCPRETRAVGVMTRAITRGTRPVEGMTRPPEEWRDSRGAALRLYNRALSGQKERSLPEVRALEMKRLETRCRNMQKPASTHFWLSTC